MVKGTFLSSFSHASKSKSFVFTFQDQFHATLRVDAFAPRHAAATSQQAPSSSAAASASETTAHGTCFNDNKNNDFREARRR